MVSCDVWWSRNNRVSFGTIGKEFPVMLFFADGFLNELDQSRMFWIGGALSYGKTRFAVDTYMSAYADKGYDLVTNFKTILSRNYYENLHDIDFGENRLLNLWLILDEGGRYMRNYKVIDPIAFAAAKLNCYIAMPGRRAPHIDLLELSVTPLFSTKKIFGIDFATVWRYSVDERKKSYAGIVLQVLPQAVHGVYSTLDPSYTPVDILKYFQDKTVEFAEKEGQYMGGVEEFASTDMADTFAALFVKERFSQPLPIPESKKGRK